jgi:hypothetical protein
VRLTIIPSDSAVYVDGISCIGLNLNGCQIPNDVHALQWYETHGEIEYKDILVPNEQITNLPNWAVACVDLWNAEQESNNS